ncbi:MAG: hypothetical protein L0Z53_07190 [Acidobacteriales bacterium]|nr:hypothetical protein [Terriglobales bacterium]
MKYTKEELDRAITPAKVKQLEAIVGIEVAAELIQKLYAALGSKSKELSVGVGYKASGTPNVDFAPCSSLVDQMTGAATVAKGKSLVGSLVEQTASATPERAGKSLVGSPKSMVERMADGDDL